MDWRRKNAYWSSVVVYIKYEKSTCGFNVLENSLKHWSAKEKYAAEGFGLELDGRLRVKTKNDGHRTQVPGIYTAGDMRRGQFLVVWAIREGGMPRERSMRT
ncbi:MAG: hypothetical protein V8S37_00900 [Lachnospiraceae bacterium]